MNSSTIALQALPKNIIEHRRIRVMALVGRAAMRRPVCRAAVAGILMLGALAASIPVKGLPGED